jgi:rSAM/selenodomain-associated transferase 2
MVPLDPVMTQPTISVVIPVYQDHITLTRLLDALDHGDERPDEVIIVSADGDGEFHSSLEGPGRRVIEAPANRGAQMDAGAQATTGDVLWFLHADAGPARGAIAAIRAAIRSGAESGCFSFVFAGDRTATKSLLEWLIGMLGGMVYGDQGIFARTDIYRTCGGFSHAPLFEEVALVRALQRRGSFVCLSTAIQVSPRRWDRDGWLRRSAHNRWLAACYMFGVPAAELARRYRGAGQRKPQADK